MIEQNELVILNLFFIIHMILEVFAPHQPSKEIKERFSKKMITPVRSDAMPRASSRRHLHQGSHLKSGGAPQVETLNHPG